MRRGGPVAAAEILGPERAQAPPHGGHAVSEEVAEGAATLLPARLFAAATALTKITTGWYAARRAGIHGRGRWRAGGTLRFGPEWERDRSFYLAPACRHERARTGEPVGVGTGCAGNTG